MAATGKKINELNSISTVTDSTVFPAVYVDGSTISNTANKVSISQLKTNLQNNFYTKNEIDIKFQTKQNQLTAGTNIVIEEDSDEGTIISSPNSIQSLSAKIIVTVTQTEYDALSVKDPNTLYLIIEGSN